MSENPDEHPAAANIATAKDMHHNLGYSLQRAGTWLFETAAGLFKDIEEAIEHIVK